MENATKALLIAAAILVAIVIISIGMVVLNQTSGTQQEAGQAMSDAEITKFNATFEAYCGNNVNGDQLNKLIKAVSRNNENENGDGQRFIQVKVGTSDTYGGNGAYAKIDTTNVNYPRSKSYTIKVTEEYNSGVIKQITATEK